MAMGVDPSCKLVWSFSFQSGSGHLALSRGPQTFRSASVAKVPLRPFFRFRNCRFYKMGAGVLPAVLFRVLVFGVDCLNMQVSFPGPVDKCVNKQLSAFGGVDPGVRFHLFVVFSWFGVVFI